MTMQQVLEFDKADRMRRALRVSGVSVQEMAEFLRVSRNTIGNWINGRAEPRPRDLIDFADKTGVPVSWIETGKLAGEEPVPSDYSATDSAIRQASRPATASRPPRSARGRGTTGPRGRAR